MIMITLACTYEVLLCCRFPWIFPELHKEYVATKILEAVLTNQPVLLLPRVMYLAVVAKRQVLCADITLCYTALHCTALHCTALHCTALHCTALHCTALHCTTLHYTTLHYTTLHYTQGCMHAF